MTTDALRALARELAPLIAEELGLEKPSARPATSHGRYDHRTIVEFLSPLHLGDSVLLRARMFFAQLAKEGRGWLTRARGTARPEGSDQHPRQPHEPAQEARHAAGVAAAVGGGRRPGEPHCLARPRRHRGEDARGDRRGDRAAWCRLTPGSDARKPSLQKALVATLRSGKGCRAFKHACDCLVHC